MRLATTSEESIVEWLRCRAAARRSKWLRVGIGDDCAVLRPLSESLELVATTDQIIENKHFIKSLHPPGALGRKILARGLSDLAAMGASPAWFLLSLGLPETIDNLWLEQFFDEMFDSIERFDPGGELVLAGGDLAAAERFTAHITACGAAPAGGALTRSGAAAGDRVYVSGRLGGAALGLAKVLAGTVREDDPATDRHLRPTPRLALGVALREAGATAAIDLSDGLSTDLGRLAEASDLQARLHVANVPCFAGASLELALNSGEEYELLFTAPSQIEMPTELAGSPITPIGELVAGAGVVDAGDERPITPGGFDHFRRGANSSS